VKYSGLCHPSTAIEDTLIQLEIGNHEIEDMAICRSAQLF